MLTRQTDRGRIAHPLQIFEERARHGHGFASFRRSFERDPARHEVPAGRFTGAGTWLAWNRDLLKFTVKVAEYTGAAQRASLLPAPCRVTVISDERLTHGERSIIDGGREKDAGGAARRRIPPRAGSGPEFEVPCDNPALWEIVVQTNRGSQMPQPSTGPRSHPGTMK